MRPHLAAAGTTMPLKVFHTFSRMIRFDHLESRPARRVTDKLAAITEVWEKRVKAAACSPVVVVIALSDCLAGFFTFDYYWKFLR